MIRSATSPRSRPYIVDVEAQHLRCNPDMSKDARDVYNAMRSLGDRKTGALKIGDRWLKASAIYKAAELCRDRGMIAVRELVALGRASWERHRVERVIQGRRRVVLGRVHYYVHREPIIRKTAQTRPFLLQSISSTVEKIDRQFLSNPPTGAMSEGSLVSSAVLGQGKGEGHHHPAQPQPDDYRPHSNLSDSNPFVIDEDANTVEAIRRKLVEDHPELYSNLKLEAVSDEWFVIAMDYIEKRSEGKISSPVAYFTKAFRNLLYNITAGSDVESDRSLLHCINADYDLRLQLRAKHGIEAGMVTPESEDRRQEFLRVRGGGP
jgi:hypothetical protein